MFNTVQFLHRLTRKLRTRDLGALGAADKMELLDAANAGFTKYLKTLPPERKQSPESENLKAPLDLTINILTNAKGFTYVTGGGDPFPIGGYALEENLLGHSAFISGDRTLNRLHRTGQFLSGYLGSSGDVTATFYGDCVQHGQDDRRVTVPPIWYDQTSERQLIHAPRPENRWPNYPFIVSHTLQIGTPEYWWTEPLLGSERTTTPTWLLRVWPLPATAGVLRYTKEAFPAALTLEDFTTARTLPVQDREVPDLLNLCEANLIGSSLLREGIDKNDLRTAAATSLANLTEDQLPQHSEHNHVGTPEDF